MTNRELDELIAEQVMGLKLIRNESEVPLGWHREEGREFLKEPHPVLDVGTWNATFEKHRGIGFKTVPPYSTDLNEAFRVVEKMREEALFSIYLSDAAGEWGVEISYVLEKTRMVFCKEEDESLARAICLCALKVIQEMEKCSSGT